MNKSQDILTGSETYLKNTAKLLYDLPFVWLESKRGKLFTELAVVGHEVDSLPIKKSKLENNKKRVPPRFDVSWHAANIKAESSTSSFPGR